MPLRDPMRPTFHIMCNATCSEPFGIELHCVHGPSVCCVFGSCCQAAAPFLRQPLRQEHTYQSTS